MASSLFANTHPAAYGALRMARGRLNGLFQGACKPSGPALEGDLGFIPTRATPQDIATV